MSSKNILEHARAFAGRIWKVRSVFELEAAERFKILVSQLPTIGASEAVVSVTRAAVSDELRHAELCENLAAHFGEPVTPRPAISVQRFAPSHFTPDESVLFEMVAATCVVETLSTALLGSLIARSRDSLAKQTMESILEDETRHSRLGWEFLADQRARGAADCISAHLAAMLGATVGDEFSAIDSAPDPSDEALTGFGVLDRPERRRLVSETLDLVVFPGLERHGFDTALGKKWFLERTQRTPGR